MIPADYLIGQAIMDYYHRLHHHERLVTHDAIISAGYRIDGGRQAIRQPMRCCVVCRKQRAPLEQQLMASLPPDRIIPADPFINTGLDVMDPWRVHYGKFTRGKTGDQKVSLPS